jgi:hypothetical protein
MGLGRQGLQPFDFDLEAGADQAEFGKMRAQGVNLASVTAIERRQGSQGMKVIKTSFSVILYFTCPKKPCPYAIIRLPKSESTR